jgi:hypothetical protein
MCTFLVLLLAVHQALKPFKYPEINFLYSLCSFILLLYAIVNLIPTSLIYASIPETGNYSTLIPALSVFQSVFLPLPAVVALSILVYRYKKLDCGELRCCCTCCPASNVPQDMDDNVNAQHASDKQVIPDATV